MYRYHGEVIKLNDKDYQKLEKTFNKLDLNMELMVMDMAFQEERPANWYMAMLYKLRYQQDKAKPQSTRDRPLVQDLTDRSWADNIVELKQIKG